MYIINNNNHNSNNNNNNNNNSNKYITNIKNKADIHPTLPSP